MTERDYTIKHWQNIAAYMRRGKVAFFRSADRIALLYAKIPPDVPFELALYPGIKLDIEKELRYLASQLQVNIVNGINNEWMLSNAKNDLLVTDMLGGKSLPPALQQKWMGRNLAALNAFTKRTEGGLGLSDRVWSLVRQNAINIEQHMALGIKEGTSASKLASEMKQYLNDPDKLFRRVRDAGGELRLSKAASEYNPGRGRYRSAYKNAMRLTRTETNRAYQQADNARWNDMDFVLGIEVRRSNTPYQCDICEAGKGKYPKDYNWILWHPNCRCNAVPIRASRDAFLDSVEAAGKGQDYQFDGYVKDVPDSWNNFQQANPNYTHWGHD